jgi:flagellar assembly protein FliH
MSSVIPKEQLAAYSRWQANDFDEKPEQQPDLPAPPIVDEPLAEDDGEDRGEAVDGPISLPTADEIENIHEQARQEGYQAGLEEGRLASEAALREATALEMARIGTLTANFFSALENLDQNIAEQTLDLALEVAAQVLRGALNTHRELLIPVVREALLALPVHHGNIALHANPDDIASLREGLGEILTQGGMHLVTDSTISPGGCLIKAGQSEIDATLETRWKRVLEAIGVDPEQWLIH